MVVEADVSQKTPLKGKAGMFKLGQENWCLETLKYCSEKAKEIPKLPYFLNRYILPNNIKNLFFCPIDL